MYAVGKIFEDDRGKVQIRTFGKIAIPRNCTPSAIGKFALVEILSEMYPGKPRGVFDVSVESLVDVGRDTPPLRIMPTQFSMSVYSGVAVVTPNNDLEHVPLKLLGEMTRRSILATPGIYAVIVCHGFRAGGWRPDGCPAG